MGGLVQQGRKVGKPALPTVVVAPNAFKETFSPHEAARLIARGLRRALQFKARLLLMPVADGGDGTLDALRAFLGGRLVTLPVTGPLGTPVRASYLRSGGTAVSSTKDSDLASSFMAMDRPSAASRSRQMRAWAAASRA